MKDLFHFRLLKLLANLAIEDIEKRSVLSQQHFLPGIIRSTFEARALLIESRTL